MSKFHELAASRRKAEQILGGVKNGDKLPERPASDLEREAEAAKTARLRAARLAKEAEERNAAPPAQTLRRKSRH